MKWMPSSLGAEPKKIAILGVLLAALGFVYWSNSGPDIPPQAAAAARPATTAPAAAAPKATVAPRPPAPRVVRAAGRSGSDDFAPTLKIPEDFDLATVDPNLNLDLLARVRAVGEVGGKRSLFEFYTPPPPPPPKVEPIKPKEVKPPPTAAEAAAERAKAAASAKKVVQPPPFKFFGYEGRPGDPMRRALFVDGEDSFVVAEGQVVRDRFKVTRIGITSVELEDTVSKDQHTLQIVPLADQ